MSTVIAAPDWASMCFRTADLYLNSQPVAGVTVGGFEKTAADAVGEFALTLTNLVVGSAIRVEVASTGALVELRTAASTAEVLAIPAYSTGSPNNDLRVKVRKASAAPLYKPYETLVTAVVGSGSVYIAQILD